MANLAYTQDTPGSTIDKIDLAAGPRTLPDWVAGAAIDWMEGWGNSPHLHVLCRRDPLAFDHAEHCCRFIAPKVYISEQAGVASVHYHDGAVRPTQFTRKTGGTWDMSKPQLLDGKPWVDTTGLWPDQIAGAKPKMGGIEHETYTMLATTVQQGYGGRAFDVHMHPDDPHHGGETIRLRGPWHSGAPEGFVEVYYYIVKPEDAAARHLRDRPWYKRGGYFGLYIRAEVMLDIVATYLPHVEWFWEGAGNDRRLRPMRPETGLPKGQFVDPADCPGHRYGVTWVSKAGPADRCAFCNERRDPTWRSPYEAPALSRTTGDVL